MTRFLNFGNLIFNPALVLWIDFAAFAETNKPGVEVKIAGDEQTWMLTGSDRDRAFDWLARNRDNPNDEFAVTGTKVFNLKEIRWVNRDYEDENGRAFEIVTTDGVSWKLKDGDAEAAARFFEVAVQYA